MPLPPLFGSWFNRRRSSRQDSRSRRRPKLFVEQLERREVLSGGLGQGLVGPVPAQNVGTQRPGPGQNGSTDPGQNGTSPGTVDTFARYLAGLYRDLLHRWPGASEIASWENAVQGGLDVGQVANIFTHTAEYDGNVITNAYVTLLGRQADASGVASWTAFLQDGGTVEQFNAQLLGSDEYYGRQGNTSGDWLAGLFRDELGRAPDAGAQSFYLQSLQHGASRAGVALSVVTSVEAQSQLVSGAYQEFLNRVPADSEVNYWDGVMQHGMSQLGLVTGFAGSAEYNGIQQTDSTLDPPYYALPPLLGNGGTVVKPPTGSHGTPGSPPGSNPGPTQQPPGTPGPITGPVPVTAPVRELLKVPRPTINADPLAHSGFVGSQALNDLLTQFDQPTTNGNPSPGSPSGTFVPTAVEQATFVFGAADKAVLVSVRARPAGTDQQTLADVNQMKSDLQNLGMSNIQVTASQDLVTGFLPIGAIAQLPTVTDFSDVVPVYDPLHRAGAVTTQGDQVTAADTFRAKTGNDGSGVTVGILSDSINQVDSHVTDVPGIGIAQSQSTGDLPARGVNVLKDGASTDTDEGRGMAEIIYDMAPGANLSFYSSDGGPQAMAQGIHSLAAAGAKVIVDDTIYPDEPFFNDGVLAQTVDHVASANNVVYVTSAGNEANHAWTAGFNPVTATVGNQTGKFQNFGPASSPNVLQTFSLASGQFINLDFQWDEAFLEGGSNLPQYQVQNSMAVYITDPTGTKIYATFADDNQNTDEALQRVVFQNDGNFGSDQFALAFELKHTAPGASQPTQLKWIRFDDNAPAQFQGAPAIFGHAAANGAVTVGAVPSSQPTAAEPSSSQGPVSILFDADGYRQAQPDLRTNKPNLAGPDGVNTANFPGQPAGDPLPPGTFPVFYGTSAAAAHVAAAAALLRQSNPAASAAVVSSSLETNAIHLGGSSSLSPASGMGLVHLGPLPQSNATVSRIGVGPVVDISKRALDEWEEEIAVNPANPLQQAAQANTDSLTGMFGSYFAYSKDGGLTWTGRNIGDGSDGLPLSFGDPSVVFDNFGNLFVSYIGSSNVNVFPPDQCTVLLSTDGGVTLTALKNFPCSDQPKLAAASGAVWDVFSAPDNTSATGISLQASGAPVTGLGAVGAFIPPEIVPTSGAVGGNFGGIAIGPTGQVVVSYQSSLVSVGAGPDVIMAATDPDGLGPAGFNTPVVAAPVNLGPFTPIPPQAVRNLGPTSRVVFDDSPGPHAGRVYMSYADNPAVNSPDTNIFLRSSDDNGATWSAPVRVNDDQTTNSQFFPRVAVDQSTGNVGLSWYDCRNDPGSGPGDRDGVPNTDAEVFATVSTDGGATFAANVQVSTGPSNAIINMIGGNQFGDYTGLAFVNGVMYPCWADNSTTLAGNPDVPSFDIATAALTVTGSGGNNGPQFPEDPFELNDTSDRATNLGPFSGYLTIPSLTITTHANGAPDYDWYRITPTIYGTFFVTINTKKGGDLELHLFTLRDNTLVQLGQNDFPGLKTKTLGTLIAPGQPLLVEVKGHNSKPGIQDQAEYDMSISLA